MIAQSLRNGTIYFFSSTELRERGLCPDSIDAVSALNLLRSFPAFSDDALSGTPEVRLFSASDGVLLILAPLPPQQTSTMFSQHICS